MPRINPNLHLDQTLRLSPRMLQSTYILQMNSLELREYISQTLMENPIFEEFSSNDTSREFQQLCQHATWISPYAQGAASLADISAVGEPDKNIVSLTSSLLDQLERKKVRNELFELCRYLLQNLDENGYLDPEDIEAIQTMGVPADLITQAIELLQSLEPAGIAARNLQECLLLQLQRKPIDTMLAQCIIEKCFDLLKKNRWKAIAEKIHVSEQQVQQAVSLIKSLTPCPGHDENATHETIEYIIPDVFIVTENNKLRVILNDFYLPRVHLNRHYMQMIPQLTEASEKEFMHKKIQQAQWIMNCLERRYRTLEQCANLILEAQYPFFQKETSYLVPLTQKEIASGMNMHESTVGRCLRKKYLQCDRGIFPLQYFCPRAVDMAGICSEQALRLKIAELISHEDSGHPYSDQKLSEILTSQNIFISRRTVAKYRQDAGILAAHARKSNSSS